MPNYSRRESITKLLKKDEIKLSEKLIEYVKINAVYT